MKLALVTYDDEGKYPGEGSREDAQLKNFLIQKGVDIKYEIWTNSAVDWHQYEAVILKSPWDYFDKVDIFYNWLDALDQQKVKVLNPTGVVRWNMRKQYLLEVEKAGFEIVPTNIINQKSKFQAEPFFQVWQTNKLIVKPVVSGGAKNTFVISPHEKGYYENQLNQLLLEEPFLVQPFMPEIQTKGEYSLVFFNSKFSHCVLKVPQSGDFRVQHYFGGVIIPITPPAHILDYATQLLKQFAPGCLYARVDGVESNDGFRLMELELIEPLLYLLYHEKAFENYYQALSEML